jgi:hypothetical protein
MVKVWEWETASEIFSTTLALPAKRKGARHASSSQRFEPAVRKVKFIDEHTIAVALGEAVIVVWDFRRGQHVETVLWTGTLEGYPRQMPYRAEVRGDEVCVVATDTGNAVAWFHCGRDSGSSLRLIAHPNGRAWAGILGERLSFFVLEPQSATR